MKTLKFLSFSIFVAIPGNNVSAVSASRSLISRSIAPIKSFTSAHPRLTAAAGIGGAVVGAYALYKWWKKKVVNPTRSNTIFEALYDATALPPELINIIVSYEPQFNGKNSELLSSEACMGLHPIFTMFSDGSIGRGARSSNNVWVNDEPRDLKKYVGDHFGEVQSLYALSGTNRVVCGVQQYNRPGGKIIIFNTWGDWTKKPLKLSRNYLPNSFLELPSGLLCMMSPFDIEILNPATGERLVSANLESGITAAAIVSAGRFATIHRDGNLLLRDATNLFILDQVNVGVGVTVCAVLKNNTIVLGYDSGIIKVWDLNTKTCLQRVQIFHGTIYSLAVLSDGRLCLGTDNGRINVWSVSENGLIGVCSHELQHRGSNRALGPVTRLAVRPNGQLVSVSAGTAVLWE